MEIAEYVLTEKDREGFQIRPMLSGAIHNVEIEFCNIPKGKSVQILGIPTMFSIGFLCKGAVMFKQDEEVWTFNEKGMFIPSKGRPLSIDALADSEVLVIKKYLSSVNLDERCSTSHEFPITCLYRDAVQYRDPFKSEKTISRALLPQRIIPEFALGSVETYGDDLIGQHEHPLLDQFFFSFSENDMDLLIDDFEYHMGADTLLHIPLGSNHGVSVKGKQCAHYLWIDSVLCKEGDDYLDEVHKKTEMMKSF